MRQEARTIEAPAPGAAPGLPRSACGLGALAQRGERRCGLPTCEAVQVIADGLAASGLTPLGWLTGANDLAASLAVQRKVEAELDSIGWLPAPPRPVVVTGLPRAGSAHLHHLLALSPSLRPAREWEVTSPTANREYRRSGDDRCVRAAMRRARVRAELLEVIAPHLPELAPVSVHSGEGGTQLLHHSLCSLQFLVTFAVPGYAAWLEHRDLAPAYRFWAAQLSLIAPGRARRVLDASPFHQFGLPALWAAAPDASVVLVRRDPVAAFASFVDAVVPVRRAFADKVDPAQVAADWLPVWATLLERAVDAVDAMPDAVVAVDHDDLCRDPVGVMDALGERLGIDAARPRSVRALSTLLEERTRGPAADLAALGIPPATVHDVLAPRDEHLDRVVGRLR